MLVLRAWNEGPLGNEVGFRGEHPYKMDRDARRKFWKEPLRGTEMLFCGRDLKFFSPPSPGEVPILKQRIISCFIIWRRVFYWELNHS